MVVGKHLVELGNGDRWYTFLTDDTLFTKWRETCQIVGSILDSSTAIFVGDRDDGDAIQDGKSLHWALQNLRRQFGAPKPTRALILEEVDGIYKGDGYLVERLKE